MKQSPDEMRELRELMDIVKKDRPTLVFWMEEALRGLSNIDASFCIIQSYLRELAATYENPRR